MPALIKRDDGYLYIRDIIRLSDRPAEIVMDWPTGVRFCHMAEPLASALGPEGLPVKRVNDWHGGLYQTTTIRRPLGEPYEFRLPEGGKTLATYREERPVPPPKVRKGTELRWRYERWEKYSKRDGWIPA